MGGRIILLNGASSSGKSTLARQVQAGLDAPFLHLSSDQLVDGGALPRRREAAGPFNWIDAMRPRFFDGFHRCIPAMAAAGNDLIVDHIIEYAAWRAQLSELLAGLDVFLVGVHCDVGELERRERARGDRRTGEGREHLSENRIHELGPYDYELDTTVGVDAGPRRRAHPSMVGSPLPQRPVRWLSSDSPPASRPRPRGR